MTVVSDGDSVEVGSTMNITPSDRTMDLRVVSDKGVSASLTVNQPSGLQLEKTVTVTENGETVVTPDEGKLAMGSVKVIADVTAISDRVDRYAEGVFFYDYDGVLLYYYTLSELESLSVLPSVPAFHTHLKSDGWTHTLAEVKATTVRLDVGALYTPKDYDFLIHVDLPKDNMTVALPFGGKGGVNWGDGTGYDGSKTYIHTYTSAGKYMIGSYGNMRDTRNVSKWAYTYIKEVNLGFNKYDKTWSYLGLSNLTGLERVSISRGYTSVDGGAFGNCYSLGAVVFPPTVSLVTTSLNFFASCFSLSVVILPSTATVVPRAFFADCGGLTSVVIPNNVTEISQDAFNGCDRLRALVWPLGLQTVGYQAFYGCKSLLSVSLSLNITTVSSGAFYSCTSLLEAVVPEGVTTLASSTFRYCYALSRVELPSTLTSIGDYCFQGDSSLERVVIKALTPPSGSLGIVFGGTNSTFIFYVPDESVDAYKEATGWSSFASRIHSLSELSL